MNCSSSLSVGRRSMAKSSSLEIAYGRKSPGSQRDGVAENRNLPVKFHFLYIIFRSFVKEERSVKGYLI